MSLTIEQGKMQIEALLRKVAEEQGVKLAGVRWRQETTDPPLFYLEDQVKSFLPEPISR